LRSEDLKPILESRPELVELVGSAVARKRHLFDRFDLAALQHEETEQVDLLWRIRNFFHLNA